MGSNPYYVDVAEPAHLSGWYIDRKSRTPARLTGLSNDRKVFEVIALASRPDVVAAGMPTALCGFNLQLTGPTLRDGEVTILGSDGEDLGRLHLDVVPEALRFQVELKQRDLLRITGCYRSDHLAGTTAFATIFHEGAAVVSSVLHAPEPHGWFEFEFNLPNSALGDATVYLVVNEMDVIMIDRIVAYAPLGDGALPLILPIPMSEVAAIERGAGDGTGWIEYYPSSAFFGWGDCTIVVAETAADEAFTVATVGGASKCYVRDGNLLRDVAADTEIPSPAPEMSVASQDLHDLPILQHAPPQEFPTLDGGTEHATAS